MTQQHLDRLTGTDAGFLHQESSSAHMHIGGVLIFEGPAPRFEDVLNHVRGRLHLVPRYRQKLATPPGGSGRPLWVDDTNFNLEYHMRNAALPSPGTEEQLLEMTARVASQPLDRTKPLWEFWLVEGVKPKAGSKAERWAIISKSHHALVDGISGVDLATVLLDFTAEPAKINTGGLHAWEPSPEPKPLELLFAGARGAALAAAGVAGKTAVAMSQPARSAEVLRDAAEGLGEIVWAALNPAPETPLNVPIGPHRRFTVVRHTLADYRLVKNELGGTVNDVLLTVVSGALGTWLRTRGVRTEGVEMRALVPVSVRTKDQHGELGNRLTVMRGPLPVYIEDPVARLGVVRTAMEGLKHSKQAVGVSTLVAVNDIAPPAVLAQASRLQFSTRLFNLLVTNIPGPQVPLYILGKKLEDLFPLAFLPDGHALAVAIMSYDGLIEYGLLADFDALPDLDVIALGIDVALRQLVDAATHDETITEPAGDASQPVALLPTSRRRSPGGPASDMRAKRANRRNGSS